MIPENDNSEQQVQEDPEKLEFIPQIQSPNPPSLLAALAPSIRIDFDLRNQVQKPTIPEQAKDLRFVVSPENSILNNKNASVEDIRLILNHKKSIRQISDNKKNNCLQYIIDMYKYWLSENIAASGPLEAAKVSEQKYTIISIILSYDEKIHYINGFSRLDNYIYWYLYKDIDDPNTTCTDDTVIVKCGYGTYTFKCYKFHKNRYIYDMKYEAKQ